MAEKTIVQAIPVEQEKLRRDKNWSSDEIRIFLQAFIHYKAERGSESNFLSSSEWKHFAVICSKAGIRREKRQLQEKFKALKSVYIKAKANTTPAGKNKLKTLAGIDELEVIYGGRPATTLETVVDPNQSSFAVETEMETNSSANEDNNEENGECYATSWCETSYQIDDGPEIKIKKPSATERSIAVLAKAMEPLQEFQKQLIDQQKQLQKTLELLYLDQQQFTAIYKESQDKFHNLMEQMLNKM